MIIARRYRFKKHKDQPFDIPYGEGCDLEDSGDPQCWIVRNHDRGETTGCNKPFYQIVFMLEEQAPYRAEELSLSIDSTAFRGRERQNLNDLYFDCDRSMWYQRTYRLESGEVDSMHAAQSITTAGVFRVVARVKRTGMVVDRTPFIYALPKNVSVPQYRIMLEDLAYLSDALIVSDHSAIGVGKIDNDKRFLGQWIQALSQALMVLINSRDAAVKLVKRYIRTEIQKVRNYDARVLRSYLMHGSSGKVDGICYEESHDTFENRMIKSALQQIMRYLDKACLPQPEEQKVDRGILRLTSEEQQQIEISRRRRQQRLEEQERARVGLQTVVDDVRHRIHVLLQMDWFRDLPDTKGFHYPIPCTPRFKYDRNYSQVYNLLSLVFNKHYMLSGNLDVNAYGVTKVEAIYEYWVFFKILYSLYEMGFQLNQEERQSISSHFRRYIDGTGHPEGYVISMCKKRNERENITIEVGFNCRIGNYTSPPDVHDYLTPDYYIRMSIADENHWYFFDAKYKCFSTDGVHLDDSFDLNTEVCRVAIRKYIVRMKEYLSKDDRYSGTKNSIRGSYIIGPDIQGRKDEQGVALLHLFGAESIDVRSGESATTAQADNTYGRPNHRYGAVSVRPGHDAELKLLLQLIFEYHEGILDVCWECGSTDVKATMSKANSRVHYLTCARCGAFRVDSFCYGCHGRIVKRANGNYHHRIPGEQWAFYCPACGKGIQRRSPAPVHAYIPSTSFTHQMGSTYYDNETPNRRIYSAANDEEALYSGHVDRRRSGY